MAFLGIDPLNHRLNCKKLELRMDINCEKGDQVILRDNCSQSFLGVVKSVNTDLGRIVLSDIVQLPEKKTVTGYRNFDRHEIVELKKFEPQSSDSECLEKTKDQEQAFKPNIQLSEVKYDRIKQNQNEYCYIKAFDSNFYSAISLLKTCSRIGVYGKDVSKGRNGRVSVVALSTPTNIFVFDLHTLGDDVLHKGLKEILESSDIIKIVYDCRLLSDSLKHKHLINLENVRDIEAEDVMVVFQERRMIRRHSRSLEYLSHVYLGLELEACAETYEAWTQRPLPKNLFEVLVSHVSVLIPLQDEIERKYLQKLIDASNIYNNHVRNLDFYQFLYDNPKKTLRGQIRELLVPQIQTRTDYELKKNVR